MDMSGKSLLLLRKACHMSFKKFSIAQDAPSKDRPDDKSKDRAPSEKIGDQPATQPDKTPAEVATPPKS